MSARPMDSGEPEELKGSGAFPTGAGEAGEKDGADESEDPTDGEGVRHQTRAPWHFKLLLVGSVGYLGWRAYQGVSWLAHHIH